MLAKDELRQQFRQRRDALSSIQVQELSLRIEKRVLELPQVKAGRTFFIYISVGNEVHTRTLIEALIQAERVVTVPLVTAPGVMQPCRIYSLGELAPGRYNIPAPRPECAVAHNEPVDVCIAPGLAFTERGHRLGAGGGYYDRYLARRQAGCVIGLAYEFQIAEHLPTEATDQRVDLVVTEQRVIDART